MLADDDNSGPQELQDGYSLEVNNKGGSGGGMCVALTIKTLAINTVLQSAHVHAAEGVTDEAGFQAQHLLDEHMPNGRALRPDFSVFDETAACAPAFRVIKAMVHGYVCLPWEGGLRMIAYMHSHAWVAPSHAAAVVASLSKRVRMMGGDQRSMQVWNSLACNFAHWTPLLTVLRTAAALCVRIPGGLLRRRTAATNSRTSC